MIRRGLIAESEFHMSQDPLRFLATNKTVVSGGERELSCALTFAGIDPDTKMAVSVSVSASLYDADIEVEVIFSYEWMARSKIDIIPHRHGVLMNGGEFPIWVPGVRESPTNRVASVSVNHIVTQSVAEHYAVREAYVR